MRVSTAPASSQAALSVRLGLRALLVLSLGCASPGASLPAAAPPAPAAPRNLILISIDTLRPDHLGCYGYARPTSPALDALAADSALFLDASAPSPWTKPSHASLLSGLYPSHHGATTTHSGLSAAAPHLAARLADAGFRTAAVVNSSWLAGHGLERGFDVLRQVDYVQGRREGSDVSGPAIALLRGRDRSRPFFLFVHYMDVHSDYASLPRFEAMFARPYEGEFSGSTQQLYRVAEHRLALRDADAAHLRDLYDAGIRQLDEQLGRLLSAVRGEGLLGDTLLVLVSDHGEEFGEHGSVLHGQTQYEEVVRVPLLFRGPGIPAARIDGAVSLVDVAPTVLDVLGLPAATPLDGVSLAGRWRTPPAPAPPRALFYEADVTFPPPGPGPVPVGPRRAVREGRFKLHLDLRDGSSALYDLEADPHETHDVSAERPDVAQRLRSALAAYLAAPAAAVEERPLTDEEIERLRSLGYLGGK